MVQGTTWGLTPHITSRDLKMLWDIQFWGHHTTNSHPLVTSVLQVPQATSFLVCDNGGPTLEDEDVDDTTTNYFAVYYFN